MGIRKEQPGAAKAAAKAGITIGKGKKAEEGRARAEREQARAQQRAAQQEARQAAMEWEATKMRMRSEQDFQQELSERQWEFEKFNRAKAWDIEKMEIASRNDFQQEEQERAEKIAKTAAGLKAIDESTDVYLTPEAKEEAKYQFKFKQETGSYPPKQTQERAEYGVKPWWTDPDVEFTPEAQAAKLKAAETRRPRAEYGIKPWWVDSAAANTPEAKAAKQKALELRQEKPLSATRQVGEIEAQFELEGYTPDDLRELGLDPADYPGVGREVGEAGLSSPTTQEEYNAIPRGSQYLDSDGNIRTKR